MEFDYIRFNYFSILPVWWQAVWGLISFPEYPYENPNPTPNDIHYGSGYYSLMQFSKYIKQGYKIVLVSDEHSVAAMSPDGSVLVNTSFEQHKIL